MEEEFVKELNELCKKYSVCLKGNTTSGNLNVIKNTTDVSCVLVRKGKNYFYIMCES